jgi:NTP pyrophosphatase (non-canonical NTP hydrolase)
MTFDEYQKKAKATALPYDDPILDKTIMALGVAGEAGEVAEKWKKIIGYHQGVVTEEDKIELAKEVGDVLWYLAVFADRLDLSFEDIAETNLAKLASRHKRGIIKGKGDNR